MDLQWSSAAIRDLEAIWSWLDAHNADAAELLLHQLHAAASSLVSFPRKGRPRDELFEGLRSLPVASHVIFYRIGEERIEIVRVLHGARDLRAALRTGS